MKKLLSTLAAISVFAMSSAANAQNITIVGSDPSVDAQLWVQQTLPFPVPCNFTEDTAALGTGVVTQFPTFPWVLCSVGPGVVEATAQFEIVPIPGNYSEVEIRNITANAIGGTCGPASVRANVLSWGPPIHLYIKPQYIPGFPNDCLIYGDVFLHEAVFW